LPASYEPGNTVIWLSSTIVWTIVLSDKRTSAWLKLKKDYVSGVGDSLDLVPIGAWHGNGRKAQWWSPILLALYDPGMEKLVAICKCMSGERRTPFTIAKGHCFSQSGFTDAFYKVNMCSFQIDISDDPFPLIRI
jgi:hypothetical protein